MSQTHLTVDPKKFIKPGPRTNQLPQQPVFSGQRTLVLPSSMINFEGEAVIYGKVGYVRKGNLESYLQLIHAGASTNLILNNIADKHITVVEGEGFLTRDQELIILKPGMQLCIPFGTKHRLYTEDNFVLVSVVQNESYKNTEEVVTLTEREGLQPIVSSAASSRTKEIATAKTLQHRTEEANTNPVKNTMPTLGNSITGLGGDDAPFNPYHDP